MHASAELGVCVESHREGNIAADVSDFKVSRFYISCARG